MSVFTENLFAIFFNKFSYSFVILTNRPRAPLTLRNNFGVFETKKIFSAIKIHCF